MLILRLVPAALALGAFALLPSSARAQCPGTDDAFEDNDDCAGAWSLAAGAYPGLYTEKEATDPDYFLVSVPDQHFISATASFVHANGDVDMRLYDLGCANVLDTSASTSDSETVAWKNTSGVTADFVVEVYVWSGSANPCNNYDLVIDVYPDPCVGATDDGLEDNDDCASALSGVTGTFPGLFVSKTDYDYYAYTLADGDTITVDALFSHADGDVDIILYDANACGGGLGTGLVQSSSVTDNESLSYTNTSGGPLDVVLEVNVWMNSTSDCNTYDLIVDDGSGGCVISTYCNPADGHANNAATIAVSGCSLGGTVTLDLASAPSGQFTYALIGNGTSIISQPPGSKGDLCIAGGSCLGRYAQDVGLITASGTFSTDISNSISGGANFGIPTCGGTIQSGQTWNFQYWHRQPMGQPSTFSEAISVTFQ